MVKPKKHLGQHFLQDNAIAQKIVSALKDQKKYDKILEIGPGTGVLTELLLKKDPQKLFVVEVDKESIHYLNKNYLDLEDRIINQDFLALDIEKYFDQPFAIIGNLPYNISSQIFFKILDHKNHVIEIVAMLQKEVAQRLTAKPGNKQYGILSVLLQAYYDLEYLFTVPPEAFYPPPKVFSGVIRLTRNQRKTLTCNEKHFKQVVKMSFHNRRKTLRNALKSFNLPPEIKSLSVFDMRAEQLSVDNFIELTQTIEAHLE